MFLKETDGIKITTSNKQEARKSKIINVIWTRKLTNKIRDGKNDAKIMRTKISLPKSELIFTDINSFVNMRTDI